MTTTIPCPNAVCGRVSRLGEDPLGRIFRCPWCSTKLPTATAAAADAGWTTVLVRHPREATLPRVTERALRAHDLPNSGEVRVEAFGWDLDDDDDPRPGFATSSEVRVDPLSGCEERSGVVVGRSWSSAAQVSLGSSAGASGSGQTGEGATLGRFRILGVLGEGRYATVYRAYDPILERDLALKAPRPELLGATRVIERFLSEAKALARLRHPRIVPIYEAGRAGNDYYIAMGLIEGQSLAERLARAPVPPRQAAVIAADLADALAYAHEQGVVHRDVKPANIRLDEHETAYLMDFGVAYRPESGEMVTLPPGSIVGTPAYLAPEQAGGGQTDVLPASDQYSLGAVLYELLCGRPPFSGPPSYVLFHAIHVEPPSPHAVEPKVPRPLSAICLKALAKQPERRYETCVEFAADLRRWLAGSAPVAQRRSWALSRG